MPKGYGERSDYHAVTACRQSVLSAWSTSSSTAAAGRSTAAIRRCSKYTGRVVTRLWPRPPIGPVRRHEACTEPLRCTPDGLATRGLQRGGPRFCGGGMSMANAGLTCSDHRVSEPPIARSLSKPRRVHVLPTLVSVRWWTAGLGASAPSRVCEDGRRSDRSPASAPGGRTSSPGMSGGLRTAPARTYARSASDLAELWSRNLPSPTS